MKRGPATAPGAERPGRWSSIRGRHSLETVPAVPALLVEQLAAGRRAGATFEQAWPQALAAALRAAKPAERPEWDRALHATVDSWAQAWLRGPASRLERALQAVAEDPDRVPLPARECAAA